MACVRIIKIAYFLTLCLVGDTHTNVFKHLIDINFHFIFFLSILSRLHGLLRLVSGGINYLQKGFR